MDLVVEEMEWVHRSGPEAARLGMIAWGSTSGAVREAAARMTEAGLPTAVLSVELLSPLPTTAIREFVGRVDEVVVVELSFSGQFARWLRAEGVDLEGARTINRGGGDPFTAEQIIQRVRETQNERDQEVLSKGLQG